MATSFWRDHGLESMKGVLRLYIDGPRLVCLYYALPVVILNVCVSATGALWRNGALVWHYIYSRWTRRRAIEGNGKKLEDGDPTPQNGLPNARTESLTECTSFVCPDTRSRLSADDRIALFALFSYDPRVCIVHATNGHLFMPAVASVTTPLPARP